MKPLRLTWLALPVLLAGCFATGAGPAQAEPAAEDDAAPALVRRMAQHVAGANSFSVTLEISFDAVQPDGQKIEFGETRRVAVRRPDRMRVDTVRRDGARRGFVYDGQQITAFDLDEKVYAAVPKSGTLDEVISYIVDDLEMRLPLAMLYASDLPEEIRDIEETARTVGVATVGGALCDHVVGRGEGVDVQLWIEQGEQPLLRRVVITYRDSPGQPQFRADLSGWDLAPDLPDSLFAFAPAEGAERVPFAPGARTGGAAGEARP